MKLIYIEGNDDRSDDNWRSVHDDLYQWMMVIRIGNDGDCESDGGGLHALYGALI